MEQCKRLASKMGFPAYSQDEAADYFMKMYKLFKEKVFTKQIIKDPSKVAFF